MTCDVDNASVVPVHDASGLWSVPVPYVTFTVTDDDAAEKFAPAFIVSFRYAVWPANLYESSDSSA